MIASDKLFILIKSLTPSEKRYFTIFCTRHLIGKKNNYVTLFTIIDSHPHYDEAYIKSQLSNSKLQKNFSSLKVKLYDLILRAMREYNTRKTLEIQVREMLDDAEFLLSKLLYQDCQEILIKSKKIAYQIEDYGAILRILRLERLLLHAIGKKDIRTHMEELWEERNTLMNIILTLEQTYTAYDKVYIQSQFSKHTNNTIELDEIMYNLNVDDPLLGFTAKNNYFNSYMLYYRICGDITRSVKYCKEVVDLWNQYPVMAENSPLRYIKVISNYCSLCIRLKLIDEFNFYLEKLSLVKIYSFEEEAEKFRAVSHLQLLYCLNTAAFSEAKFMLNTIEEGIKKYKAKIDLSRLLTLYHNISVLFFLIQDYNNSVLWLNKIIECKKIGVRQDILDFSHILLLVLHYELGNWSYISSLYRNTARYFKQKENLSIFFRIFKELHILTLIDVEDKNRQYFLKIQKIIHNTKDWNKQIGLQELNYWIESKITEQRIDSIAKQQILSMN